MSVEDYRLLRRPRSLPDFGQLKPGKNAEYKIKVVYYKNTGDVLPRVCYNAKAEVCFAHLLIKSSLPPTNIKIPLVSICYIETEQKYNRFDIRGRSFQLHLVGFKDVMQPTNTLEESRDWFRFLVVRQRIPHAIMKIPFEWELQLTQIRKISKFQQIFRVFKSIFSSKNQSSLEIDRQNKL